MAKQWTEEELVSRIAEDSGGPFSTLTPRQVIQALLRVINNDLSPGRTGPPQSKSPDHELLREGAPSGAERENSQGRDLTRSASPGELAQIVFELVIERLRSDPALLTVVNVRPEITVQVKKEQVVLDGKTLRGRLAILISEGFFESAANGNSAFNELKRRGAAVAKPNVYRELDKLTEMGFLLKGDGGYQGVPSMKVNLVEAA